MNYKKMALLNTVGNIVYLFALWILTVIVTRTIGFTAAGIFSLAMSIGNVFFMIQMYGVRSFQVSDVTGEYTPSQYFLSRYITAAAGVIFCIVYCLVCGYSMEKVAAILFYTLFRTCEAISDAYFGELQKIGRLDVLAKSMLTKSVLMIAVFSGLLLTVRDLTVALLGIAVVAALVTACYDRPRCHSLLPASGMPDQPPSLQTIRGLLRKCFPLMLTTLMPIVVTSLPRILLDRYSGEELLGYYSNISTPTVLITAIVPNVLYPAMTWYGKLIQQKEWRKLGRGFTISLLACWGLGVLAFVAIWLLGDFVMALVFTDAIVPYVHYMYPLVVATVIYACTMCGNSVLIALRKNMLVTVFSALSLLTAVLCCAPLVKYYSITGAIAVLGAAYTVQLLLLLIAVIVELRKNIQESSPHISDTETHEEHL